MPGGCTRKLVSYRLESYGWGCLRLEVVVGVCAGRIRKYWEVFSYKNFFSSCLFSLPFFLKESYKFLTGLIWITLVYLCYFASLGKILLGDLKSFWAIVTSVFNIFSGNRRREGIG